MVADQHAILLQNNLLFQYYARPAAPGVGYVWVDGDWYGVAEDMYIVNGYWARPRGHRVWVTGTWVHSEEDIIGEEDIGDKYKFKAVYLTAFFYFFNSRIKVVDESTCNC